MPELSNLLRQRLGAAGSGSGVHPDADTLTAYNEKLLPGDERQKIVGHLAECMECREVLALSEPLVADNLVQPVIRPVAVSAWRRFFVPALSLGASVAAMAVIAVVMLRSPHKPAPISSPANQEAKVIPSAPKPVVEQERVPEANQPATTQTAQLQASHVSGRVRSENQSGQNELPGPGHSRSDLNANKDSAVTDPAAKKTAVAEPVLTANLPKQDFVNNNLFTMRSNGVSSVAEHDKNDFSDASATAAVFPANGTDQLTLFSGIPANVARGNSDTRILTSAPSADHAGFITKWVQAGTRTLRKGTLSPSIRAGTLGNSALGGPGMFALDLQKRQPAEVSAAPEKAEAGSLEKSGALSRRALSSPTLRSQESGAMQWKVAGGKLLKSNDQSQWLDAYPAAAGGVEFSSVAWHGSDVWAGGSRTMLVHSRDGGLTWEDVKLGEAASGSIMSIVAGSLNVQVRTSDNQVW